MKKKFVIAFMFIVVLFIRTNAQGYELQFLRVVDTAFTFTVPCNTYIPDIGGVYYDILSVNTSQDIVSKIESISVSWPGYLTTSSSTCGSGGAGQFRLQPALKKNGLYMEITGDNNTGNYGASETKWRGVYWATKGTTIGVKASMASSSSYHYLGSNYTGKIRISLIEFLIVP